MLTTVRKEGVFQKATSNIGLRNSIGIPNATTRSFSNSKKNGWNVLVVWECELSDRAAVKNKLNEFMNDAKTSKGFAKNAVILDKKLKFD